MRIALATFAGMPPEFGDDEKLLGLLRQREAVVDAPTWDDPAVDWDSYGLVVARSPWDYTTRLGEFLAWVDSVGERLENPPAVIRWNSDKHYLADLGEDGVPVVPTVYVPPGDDLPVIDGEIVIKPTVSAGARRTGRFTPASAEPAGELIGRIHGDGATAMVQPYVASVDSAGETAVITIAGEVSHVLRKGALLAPDRVAPVRENDALGVAEAMYDPELVVAGSAEADELDLAGRVIDAIRARFGVTPLIARVDMLRGEGGDPVVLELEAIEPNLYFGQSPGAAERLADAIVARAARGA